MAEGAPQIGSKNEASQASPMTPREIVSELDRYIVGQKAAKRAVAIALRNRWRRQQVAGGSARRDRAEEHHHDRPDRRRQDRDRAPARQARPGAVPQGRGVEVHRGRLRRPRRRVDDPRPRRAGDQHGEGGGEGEGADPRARERRGARPRPAAAAASPWASARMSRRAWSATRTRRERARSSVACSARASSTTASSRSRSPASGGPMLRDHDAAGHGGDGAAPARIMFANLMPKKTKQPAR